MSRVGRYLPHGVVLLARVAGRYEPYWPLFCRMKWRFWPISVAATSRSGRRLLYEVAVLACIAGRYEPYWPLFAV